MATASGASVRHLPLGERLEHPAGADALRDAHDVTPGHERWWMVARQIVECGAVLTSQPQQVLEPARRDQYHARAAPLEQRVGRDRGAVDQEFDGRRVGGSG